MSSTRPFRNLGKQINGALCRTLWSPARKVAELYRSKYILTGNGGPVFTHVFVLIGTLGYFNVYNTGIKYHDPRYLAHKSAENHKAHADGEHH